MAVSYTHLGLRIVPIYNAIDLERFSPAGDRLDLDAKAGLAPPAPGTVRVGLIATFARWKGHKVFLEALARVSPDVPIRGYIIGGPIYQTDGSQWSALEPVSYTHLPAENSLFPEPARQPYVMVNPADEETDNKINPGRLLRKYWLLLAALLLLGAGAGFISVVLSPEMYRGRLLMEVQNSSGNLPRVGGGASDGGGSTADNEVTIQTQISIMHGGSFLKKGAERMQSETVPLAPTGRDIFSRLRQRIHPATQDPLEAARVGLSVAMTTFDARPVIRTRLIELSCESTSPDVAAQYLNSMAAEFSDDSSRSRMQTAQRTSEWLAAQIEETKTCLLYTSGHRRASEGER